MCGTYDVRPNWHTFPKKKRFRLFETWTIMSQKRKLRRGEKCHKPALCPHVIPSCVSRYNLKNNSSYIPEKTKRLFFWTFCWPCISVYLSQYLTNLMHKICSTVSFISCLYMFRAHVLIIRRTKIALHSLWYHHTYRCQNYITQPLVSSYL